ncbi:galectin-1-like, partial [Vombatus ursinus]|uniref:galectin-1-like n=1 Tax=Vombatus ursinus TaxID=29139 RepID=UPI000FFD14FE
SLQPISAFDLNLKPGSFVRIMGDILPDAKHFTIDIGEDDNNFALHFNARFNYLGSHKVIILNTKRGEYFGREKKMKHFPFVQGTRTEIFIAYDEKFFVIKLPDGFVYSFLNRTNTNKINYVGAHGDFAVRSLAFE